MTLDEAMQRLAAAWLEAPRTPLGHTPDGRSRGDLVKCPACGHLILMTRSDATEHLAHHRDVANLTPFRFWREVAPITGMWPVALGERDNNWHLPAPTGTREAVARALAFVRQHWALLARAGLLKVKRARPADFALIAQEDWMALLGMTAQEDFAQVALGHYEQQALLRPMQGRRPQPLVH